MNRNAIVLALLVVATTGCHSVPKADDPTLSTSVLDPDRGWTARLQSIPYHEPKTTEHVVAKRDTLWSIARRYAVTVAAIERANPKLEARSLEVGTRVRIPRRVVWPASGRTTK